MKLLIDMNLSPVWVSYLADAGFEVVHWSTVGPGTAPDSELLRWAAEHEQVVVTSRPGLWRDPGSKRGYPTKRTAAAERTVGATRDRADGLADHPQGSR